MDTKTRPKMPFRFWINELRPGSGGNFRLDLPRGGLAPPILCQLPGALAVGSNSAAERRARRRRNLLR